jgi:hypothetical protein
MSDTTGVCLGEFHLFEIMPGFGDSCLCGATYINDAGKTVRKESDDDIRNA